MHAHSNHNTNAGAVIPYYLTGAIAFVIVAFLCLLSADSFFGHYFQPRLLAITHIAALGWGSMVIFGALFQFLPVLLEVRLFSEKLSKITFWLMLVGVPILAYSFWTFSIGITLQISSLIIILAILLFGINIYKTAKQTAKWNIAADFIVTSLGWLLLTAIAGALLVFNFTYLFLPKPHLDYLKVHAHLGIIGWFLLLIIGVSSRLIPMFLVSQKPDTKHLSLSYYLINLGLIAFIADALIFFSGILVVLAVLSILAGLIAYLLYIRTCYIKRVRKALDTGMKQSLIAFLFLALPLAVITSITLAMSGESFMLPFYIAYGFSIFFGFISTLILGQTYKTLPFIVWLNLSKHKRTDKRLPKDLFSEKLAKNQFILHIAGFITILIAIFLKLKIIFLAGTLCLLLSAILFNINIFKLLFHLISKPNEPGTR